MSTTSLGAERRGFIEIEHRRGRSMVSAKRPESPRQPPGVDSELMSLLDDSDYWTTERRQLAQWFYDNAPSFVEGYVAAVRLLHSPSFPARVHLICHVVRDIYRYLPEALGATPRSTPNNAYEGPMNRLANYFKPLQLSETTEGNGVSPDVAVSPQVYRCVAELVDAHKGLREQSRIGDELARTLFRSLDRRSDDFIPPWIMDCFHAEYKFFVSRAHLARRTDKVPTDDDLRDNFEAFERAFHSMIGPYFTGKDELDAILQDTNTTTD